MVNFRYILQLTKMNVKSMVAYILKSAPSDFNFLSFDLLLCAVFVLLSLDSTLRNVFTEQAFLPWNRVCKAHSWSPRCSRWTDDFALLHYPLQRLTAPMSTLLWFAPPAATYGFTGVPCYPILMYVLSWVLLSWYLSAFVWWFGEIEKYSMTIIFWEFLTKFLISFIPHFFPSFHFLPFYSLF